MSILKINLTSINEHLEELDADFKIKPVGVSEKLYWLYEIDNLYALKVSAEFVDRLARQLDGGNRLTDYKILDQFGNEFIAEVQGSFVAYPGIGFIAKDYAELFFGYEYKGYDITGPDRFFIGELEVWMSTASSLQCLLNERFNEYDDDLSSRTTLCLKGTSVAKIEDDVTSAVYYINQMMASRDDEFSHEHLRVQTLKYGYVYAEEKSCVLYEHEERFPKPLHTIPVRYFLGAESASGEISLLYFYKVLEYFFDIAWIYKIEILIAESCGDTSTLAASLAKEQPRHELESLNLVLKAIQNEELWEMIGHCQFCLPNPDTLARKIYRIRNEIAHGKEDHHVDLLVPKIIPVPTLQVQETVFRFLAHEALVKFANVQGGIDGLSL